MRHRILFSGGSPEVRKLIRSAITATLKAEGVTIPCEVNVLLTDDAEIRALNAEFRNKDTATDVLSFPACDLVPGEPLPEAFADPETGLFPLGDMALSLERAAAQAEDFGHSTEREAGYLSVHSILHLLGYDHEDEADRRAMRAREEAVMAALKLTRE